MNIRKIDQLGRVRIPIKVTRKLEVSEGQEMEIIMEYGRICIKKFQRENIQERPYVGIVRKLDELNRLTIPRCYIDWLKIELGTHVKLEFENEIGVIRVTPLEI